MLDYIASESQGPNLFKCYLFPIVIWGSYNVFKIKKGIHEYFKIFLELIYIFHPVVIIM